VTDVSCSVARARTSVRFPSDTTRTVVGSTIERDKEPDER
jgi:hypothetical protein